MLSILLFPAIVFATGMGLFFGGKKPVVRKISYWLLALGFIGHAFFARELADFGYDRPEEAGFGYYLFMAAVLASFALVGAITGLLVRRVRRRQSTSTATSAITP